MKTFFLHRSSRDICSAFYLSPPPLEYVKCLCMCHDICHHQRDHTGPSATGTADNIQLLSLEILLLLQGPLTGSLDSVTWLAIGSQQNKISPISNDVYVNLNMLVDMFIDQYSSFHPAVAYSPVEATHSIAH